MKALHLKQYDEAADALWAAEGATTNAIKEAKGEAAANRVSVSINREGRA